MEHGKNPKGIYNKTASSYYRMFADFCSLGHYTVCSYPYLVLNYHFCCADTLIQNRQVDINVIMIKPGNNNILSKYDIIPNFDRADNNVANPYSGSLANFYSAHHVVKCRKIFNYRFFAY